LVGEVAYWCVPFRTRDHFVQYNFNPPGYPGALRSIPIVVRLWLLLPIGRTGQIEQMSRQIADGVFLIMVVCKPLQYRYDGRRDRFRQVAFGGVYKEFNEVAFTLPDIVKQANIFQL
jgi:hypothetical protein